MTGLGEHIVKLYAMVAEISRRQDGRIAQGTVDSVDAKAGTVRILLGQGENGEKFLSAPVPYAQFMGALKMHTPPSVGQQMTVMSGAGDFRLGLAIPMTQSDQNKSPSEKADENVATYGPFRIKLDGLNLTVTRGGISVDISGSGVAIKADVKIEGKFEVTGDAFTHNGKDVGHDHEHTDVEPGGGLTGPPK